MHIYMTVIDMFTCIYSFAFTLCTKNDKVEQNRILLVNDFTYDVVLTELHQQTLTDTTDLTE